MNPNQVSKNSLLTEITAANAANVSALFPEIDGTLFDRFNVFRDSAIANRVEKELLLIPDREEAQSHLETFLVHELFYCDYSVFNSEDSVFPCSRQAYTQPLNERLDVLFDAPESIVAIGVHSRFQSLRYLLQFLTNLAPNGLNEWRAWNKQQSQCTGQVAFSALISLILYPGLRVASSNQLGEPISWREYAFNVQHRDNLEWANFFDQAGIGSLITDVIFSPACTLDQSAEMLNEVDATLHRFDWTEFQNPVEWAPLTNCFSFEEKQTAVEIQDESLATTAKIADEVADSSTEIVRLRVELEGTKRSRALDAGERHTIYLPAWIPNESLGLYSVDDFVMHVGFHAPQSSGDMVTGLYLESTAIPLSLLPSLKDPLDEAVTDFLEDHCDWVKWSQQDNVKAQAIHSFWVSAIQDLGHDHIDDVARYILEIKGVAFGWGNADPADALEDIVRNLIIAGCYPDSDDEDPHFDD